MPVRALLAIAGLVNLAVAAQQVVDTESWRPAPCSLTGSIVDSSGAAIAGAELRLWTREGERQLELGGATSDARGRFELPWLRPSWDVEYFRATLRVTAPRFAPTVVDNVFLLNTSYELGLLTLHEPVELRGRVRTRAGEPISGAHVYGVVGPVRGVRPELWNLAPLAVTDASGSYVCRTLPPGRVTLSAGASGFADAPDSALTLDADGSNTQDFVLEVAPTRTLTVRSRFDKPIAAVEVGPPGAASAMAERFGYLSTHAFWRGPWRGDERGVVRVDGVASQTELDVRIRARGYRDKFVPLRSESFDVQLDSVTWIEVNAVRSTGSAPLELYQVRIRDGSEPTNWCGVAEDMAWRHVFANSPAVEVLAPDRWRIAWNSPECIVSGGAPSSLIAVATDGSLAAAQLRLSWPAPSVSAVLGFDAPTAVTGIVRDAEGQPVSLRLGTQLGLGRPDFITTTSDERGRFSFAQLGGASDWLHAFDRRWELEPNSRTLELAPGTHLPEFELVVRERPPELRSSVRCLLLIDGRTPFRPVLVALESSVYSHVPDCAPAALVWTDREGRFEFSGTPGASYHAVPQFRADFEPSGWVDFGGAFPRHGRQWPFSITLPASGEAEVVLRLPGESVWSSLAPPREDR